jgi:serine/threonine-protein kinase
MATVYLAEDLRHQRKVALKVLRQELAVALGPERFSREIRIAAALQHPHILPLLDSGEAGGFLYYVMPFIEGESLRERLGHGELPVSDAIRILAEVADALAHAHAHGVVHRDIKPDNVLLSGRHALVADFGVAKAVSEATGRNQITTAGVAIGTPAYMAPEQAMADPHLDHRVDLYALGVLGYEMLTGRPVFSATTAQAMLAAHATQEPEPVDRLRPGIPPALTHAIMRCLAKRPADRWQRADDLVAQLEPLRATSSETTAAGTQPMVAAPRTGPRAKWVASGAAAALALVLALALGRPGRPVVTIGKRTTVTLEPGIEAVPSLSPDGKLVAYVRQSGGESRLYTKQIAGGAPVMVSPPSVGPVVLAPPAWSPDGSRLLYETARGLEIVPGLGGVSKVVVSRPFSAAPAAAWSPDGERVVISTDSALSVRGLGDTTSRLLVRGTELHSPAWSPDGEWIAYVSGNAEYVFAGNLAPSAVWVVRSTGGAPVRVTPDQPLNASPVWLPDSRRLLFVSTREGGRDVYQATLGADGKPQGAPVRLTTGLNPHTIGLSADGRHLVYAVLTETANVRVARLASGRPVSLSEFQPVTSGAQITEEFDVSADGKWLYFDSNRDGNQNIYRMLLDGSAPAEGLTSAPEDEFCATVSRDGRWVAYHLVRGPGIRDLMIVGADGGVPERVPVTTRNNFCPEWSRDGSTLAYACVDDGPHLCTVRRDSQGGWGQPRIIAHIYTGDPGAFSPVDDALFFIDSLGSAGLLIRSDGGAPREITRLPAGFAGIWKRWSDDGRTIYVSALGPSNEYAVFAIPASGGVPRLIVTSAGPSSQTYRHTFGVQGDKVYVSVADRQADVFVVEVGNQ